jgi:redox-sensing transcriptional repressor
LNQLTLERLVQYYHLIRAQPPRQETVLSARLADYTGVDSTLVRKDLAAIGVRGRTHVGYHRTQVSRAIERVFGLGRASKAVIVGAGRLGCALACYPGFMPYGLVVVALFDTDPAKVGSRVNDIPVQPLDLLEAEIRRHDVSLAVLTVPAHAAQEITERLVLAGIRAIWNFAPVNLSVHRGVFVRQEHLSIGLGVVIYHMRKRAGAALRASGTSTDRNAR